MRKLTCSQDQTPSLPAALSQSSNAARCSKKRGLLNIITKNENNELTLHLLAHARGVLARATSLLKSSLKMRIGICSEKNENYLAGLLAFEDLVLNENKLIHGRLILIKNDVKNPHNKRTA
jgi:hypothetical protein